MLVIEPGKIPTRELHQFLLGAVAPRPIAFASTIDKDGHPNLAPFSFFNAYSSNPPILVFSANRRVQNNTTKDTLHNIEQTMEVVINVVSYDIVQQMALTSVEFPPEVNEFEKSGLTPIPSDLIRPFRVKESPVQMECVVEQILPLGEEAGAGHLIICRVVRMHIDERVVDSNNRIDPHKIDLMGRMGRSYYSRASGEAIYTIVQEVTKPIIGYDALPENIRHSHILSGNDIARIAGLHEVPVKEEVLHLRSADARVIACLESQQPIETLHFYIKEAIENGNIELAGKIAYLTTYIE